MKLSDSPLDKNAYALLLHVEALTTAIEDTLSELDNSPDRVDVEYVKAVLRTALDGVWKEDES